LKRFFVWDLKKANSALSFSEVRIAKGSDPNPLQFEKAIATALS